MERTKYYDKDIYKKDKLIKTIFVILITFLVGMYVGVAINYLELQEKDSKIREQYVEIDSLRETVYQYQLKENKNNEFNRTKQRRYNRYDNRK